MTFRLCHFLISLECGLPEESYKFKYYLIMPLTIKGTLISKRLKSSCLVVIYSNNEKVRRYLESFLNVQCTLSPALIYVAAVPMAFNINIKVLF